MWRLGLDASQSDSEASNTSCPTVGLYHGIATSLSFRSVFRRFWTLLNDPSGDRVTDGPTNLFEYLSKPANRQCWQIQITLPVLLRAKNELGSSAALTASIFPAPPKQPSP